MMLTEEEARTKWCPYARDTVSGTIAEPGPGGSYNRMSKDSITFSLPESCRCIASDCMAWQFHPEMVREVIEKTPDLVEGREYRVGYCGLAGQP